MGDNAPERDGRVLRTLRGLLERGDMPGFAQSLETFVFGLAHENLQGEAGFRSLLQALFRLMELPERSEYSNWGGRADHTAHVGGRVYIFEVKYNQSARAALRQIRDRGYGRQFLKPDTNAIAVGLAFRRDGRAAPRLECETAALTALIDETRDG